MVKCCGECAYLKTEKFINPKSVIFNSMIGFTCTLKDQNIFPMYEEDLKDPFMCNEFKKAKKWSEAK